MAGAPNNRVLVAGGGGYIGSHIVIELLKKDHVVVVVDNLSGCYSERGEKPECLLRIEKLLNKSITFYAADLRDESTMNGIFSSNEIDLVIHVAGEVDTKQLSHSYENDVSATKALLKVMEKHGIFRLVYSSSGTVYGSPLFLPITEDHPVGNVHTGYARSRKIIEGILQEKCNTDNCWDLICLRYYNAASAHDSGLIGEELGERESPFSVISQVALGRREKIYINRGDYEADNEDGVCDYVHVSDVAMAHILAMKRVLSNSYTGWKAYNLGQGRGVAIVEILEAFSIVSQKMIIYEIEEEEAGMYGRYLDASLAKYELEWYPSKDLKDMCKDSIKWHRMNPNGYKTLLKESK